VITCHPSCRLANDIMPVCLTRLTHESSQEDKIPKYFTKREKPTASAGRFHLCGNIMRLTGYGSPLLAARVQLEQ
jgi:hypothetical protein